MKTLETILQVDLYFGAAGSAVAAALNGSVALGLAIAPFLFLVSATAEGVTLYECELKAGVQAKGGELRPVTDKWMRLHSPMTVDLASGIIRFGVDRSVERWKIVQNGDDSNDWQLISRP